MSFVDVPELSTDSPNSGFVLTICAAFAELGRRMIRDCQAVGTATAKAADKCDRRPKLTPEQIDPARRQERLKGAVT